MKKLIVSALALTMISFASAQAQNTQAQATQAQTQSTQATEVDHSKHTGTANQQTETTKKKADQDDKVAVKAEDLPAAIKKTIASDQFSGWTVKKAYLVTGDDNQQYYELNVANGKESARVKLDKNGNNVG